MHVFRSKDFEKSLKKILSSKKVKLREVEKTIDLLAGDKAMPVKYKDHALKGEWRGYRECHIRPDILLIYKKIKNDLILIIVDIGTHSSLFK